MKFTASTTVAFAAVASANPHFMSKRGSFDVWTAPSDTDCM